MKKKFIKYFLCCFYLAPTFKVFAHKAPPQPKPSGTPPVGLPIDNYIILALIIGAFLGVYFLKKRKLVV